MLMLREGGTANGGSGDDHIFIGLDLVRNPEADGVTRIMSPGEGQDTVSAFVLPPEAYLRDDQVGDTLRVVGFDAEQDMLRLEAASDRYGSGSVLELGRTQIIQEEGSCKILAK